MAPERVEVGSVRAVERAAEVLEAGGLVLLPTDTVYGLAVLPASVSKLFVAKQRPDDVPVALLVADEGQAEDLAVVDQRAQGLMVEHWPGALTMVMVRRDVDSGRSGATIGVRCPDDPFVRELASVVGPLATTSANLHGRPTPELASEALAQIGDAVDLVVDGGPRAGEASTVVDLTGAELRVLRQGSVVIESTTPET